jgi:hypothetical protein
MLVDDGLEHQVEIRLLSNLIFNPNVQEAQLLTDSQNL